MHCSASRIRRTSGARRRSRLANVTRADVRESLQLAAEIPIGQKIQEYALEDANQATCRPEVKHVRGAKVLADRLTGHSGIDPMFLRMRPHMLSSQLRVTPSNPLENAIERSASGAR